MKIINKSKITKVLNFNLKLIFLSSLLFSQLSLSEIFLYQNDPDTSFINMAKANASDTWYNTSYLYRKEITINSAKVPNTDQSNFPALVSLTDSALRTVSNGGKVTNASGYDIIFANQIGDTKLDHEIESYDGVTGTIVMWVKIPTLSHLNDTVIYLYYGNAGISTTQENKTGVWDSNFKMVQHMNQDPSGAGAQMKDSTINGKNGTTAGSMASGQSVDGKIGKSLLFDGSNDYVVTPTIDLTATNNMTVSMIFKPATVTSGSTKNLAEFSPNYEVVAGGFILVYDAETTSVSGFMLGNVTYSSRTSVTQMVPDTWYYLTAIFDKSVSTNEVKLYINGVLEGTTAHNGNNSDSFGNQQVYIGARGLGANFADSTIDEVRLSNIARSSDWITTEYNNQSNLTPGAGNFILPLGTEEAIATTYDLTAPSLSSGPINIPSQDFTIAPNGIYTGTITITPSGGGLSTAITKTFSNSSTSQTFTITPTIAGTVTLTLTNSGGLINPSPATYSSVSISASPSSVIQGSTGNAIDITGINTSWTAGTPGAPTFTLSGGTGASITSHTVTDPTHATITLNAGSTAGDLTITDPSTGATTTVSVVPSTANLITSFNLVTPAVTGTINDTDHTVAFTVPYGTNVTSLTPTITVSTGATISPTSGISHNFITPATYVVTAQDGTTTQNYIVTVTTSPSTAGGFISPTQPIISLQNDRIDISNLSPDTIQIAISQTPDFKDASWEAFSGEEIKQLDNCPDKLYIKFRNKSGAVSDVIVYLPKTSDNIPLSDLKDGDIVKTIDDPDVYIIKIKNNKQYKRLILSPSVFQSYGHLKWSNIKIISQEELNRYAISNLVTEKSDTIIYELFSNGDTGDRRLFDTSNSYDVDSIYEINTVDRDSYNLVK